MVQAFIWVLERIGKIRVVHGGKLVRDHTHRKTQCLVYRAHPAAAQARQVVIRGNQMRALAFDGIQIQRQRGNQRLAFAGLHLGDATRVQHRPREHLLVVVALAYGPPGRLADSRECLRQQVVEALALLKASAELSRFVAQLLRGERAVVLLQSIDLGEGGTKSFNFAVGGVAADFGQPLKHGELAPRQAGQDDIVQHNANSGPTYLNGRAEHCPDGLARMNP